MSSCAHLNQLVNSINGVTATHARARFIANLLDDHPTEQDPTGWAKAKTTYAREGLLMIDAFLQGRVPIGELTLDILARGILAEYAARQAPCDDLLKAAYLYCFFIRLDAADETYNSALNALIPGGVRNGLLTHESRPQQLAAVLFDPHWLQLYDIDFNALGGDALTRVLLGGPVLVGQLASTTVMAANLPDQMLDT